MNHLLKPRKIAAFFPEILFLIVGSGYLLFYQNVLNNMSYHIYKILWLILIFMTLIIFLIRPRKKVSTTVFPIEQLKNIESSLPHEAIQLYQSWFTLNLENCYQAHYKKMTAEERQLFVNELSKLLITTFQSLPRTQIYSTLEDRNKDHATISLIFFTVLIRFLQCKASIKKLSTYRDIFSNLLISESKKYLFREYYRLFELGSIVEESWSTLNLNSDIQGILSDVLISKVVPTANLATPIIQVNNASTQINNPIVFTNTTVLANQNSQVTIPGVSKVTIPEAIIKEKNNIEESVNEVSENSMSNVISSHESVVDKQSTVKLDKFKQWLERQLIRQPINQSKFFYQDSENFKNNILFLTEEAFIDFSRKTQISVQDIRVELTNKAYLDNTHYCLKMKNSENINLLAITLPIEWSLSLENKYELSDKIEVIS